MQIPQTPDEWRETIEAFDTRIAELTTKEEELIAARSPYQLKAQMGDVDARKELETLAVQASKVKYDLADALGAKRAAQTELDMALSRIDAQRHLEMIENAQGLLKDYGKTSKRVEKLMADLASALKDRETQHATICREVKKLSQESYQTLLRTNKPWHLKSAISHAGLKNLFEGAPVGNNHRKPLSVFDGEFTEYVTRILDTTREQATQTVNTEPIIKEIRQ